MKLIKLMILFLLLFLFATGSAEAQKIYLLTVGDVSEASGLKEAVELDLKRMNHVFSENMADFRLVVYGSDEWDGPNLLSSSSMRYDILQAIGQCPAGSDDTIVFYWSGHGAYDEDGHYFNMPKGAGSPYLYRHEVLSALKSCGARLTVLISDCCNVYSSANLGAMAPGLPPLQYTVSPLFRKLFFETHGVLDVTSSQRGETSACNSDMGSFFTMALTMLLMSGDAKENDWSSLLQATDDLVHQINPDQTLFIKSLPTTYDQGNYEDDDENEDEEDYESIEWSRPIYCPEVGDRVIRVNGQWVENEREFRAAVKNSPSTIYLEMVDHRRGGTFSMRTQLWSSQRQTRLGLNIATDSRGGVQITEIVPRSPATTCQIPK